MFAPIASLNRNLSVLDRLDNTLRIITKNKHRRYSYFENSRFENDMFLTIYIYYITTQ